MTVSWYCPARSYSQHHDINPESHCTKQFKLALCTPHATHSTPCLAHLQDKLLSDLRSDLHFFSRRLLGNFVSLLFIWFNFLFEPSCTFEECFVNPNTAGSIQLCFSSMLIIWFESIPLNNQNLFNIAVFSQLPCTLHGSFWMYPEKYLNVVDSMHHETLRAKNCLITKSPPANFWQKARTSHDMMGKAWVSVKIPQMCFPLQASIP